MKSTASRSVAAGNSRNTKHVQTGYLGKLEYFTNLKNKALLGLLLLLTMMPANILKQSFNFVH